MFSAEQWLATLGAAGVPAFHCRRSADGVAILSRTPEFIGVMQMFAGRLDEAGLLARLTAQWPTADGSTPLVIAAAQEDPAWKCALNGVDGQPGDYLAILRLPEEEQPPHDAFLTIVENLPDVVTRFDREFRCLYGNPPMARLTGIPIAARLGHTQNEVGTAPGLVAAFQAAYQCVFDTADAVELEFDYDGTAGLRHYLGRGMPEFDHDGQVQAVLSVVRDITEVKRLELRLEQLARTDPLTALLNRRSFTTRLAAELERARDGRGGLSLLMLDLDNFKYINDRFGHVTGDRVLEAVGRILLEESRSEDIAARLGGDEFCVALPDTDVVGAREIATRIYQRVAAIAGDDGRPLGIGVSVGIAAAEEQDATALDLLSRVDMLMYRAKSGGADDSPMSPRR
ncbi:sensor domain-containing diguanylate cyclase [Mycolicibacterium sp. CBM1]